MLFGKEHIKRYLETDGKVGHDYFRGTPVLLLTTVGRTSGKKRISPLIYQRDGDNYLVVGSNGGAAADPHWVQNLKANDEVEVQVWGERFPARARLATPEEKPRLWQIMTEIWPDYDTYQGKTDRDIPVVILET